MHKQDLSTPQDVTFRVTELRCRRTGEKLPLAEHEQCPYCFGRTEDMATGQYERFCDFRPGRDPLHFGFPPDTAREREG